NFERASPSPALRAKPFAAARIKRVGAPRAETFRQPQPSAERGKSPRGARGGERVEERVGREAGPDRTEGEHRGHLAPVILPALGCFGEQEAPMMHGGEDQPLVAGQFGGPQRAPARET